MGQLWATLDRFEDNKAVLILSDGQNIIVSRDDLDPRIKAGDVVSINFSRNLKQSSKQEKNVKKLLTKILTKNNEAA
jgi:hypothetical protein